MIGKTYLSNKFCVGIVGWGSVTKIILDWIIVVLPRDSKTYV